MASLTRGDWLEVVREVWGKLMLAEANLHKWETRERQDRPPTAEDADEYIDQMTPVWRLRAEKIADARDAVTGARREWNALKKKALSGTDGALSRAWLEWMFEADRLSEGFDELRVVLGHSANVLDDTRLRAAMTRGGYSVSEPPSW